MPDATVGIRLTGVSEYLVESAMRLMGNINITWGVIRQEEGKYWYVIGRINDLSQSQDSYRPKEEVVRWD